MTRDNIEPDIDGGATNTPVEFTNPQQRLGGLDKLAEALSKAQGQIKGAAKDTTNPHFKSKYADLASVWDACRKALADNGLSVIQYGAFREGAYVIRTRLLHSSGQYIEGDVPCQTDARSSNQMQALGSAITYARRYGLAAMVGVSPEDDDGEGAAQKPTTGNQVWGSKQGAKAWEGPLNKTKLKAEMHKFSEDLKDCTDLNMLAGLQESYKDVLQQCAVDWPECWEGTADQRGAAQAIIKKQAELQQAEQS